MSDDLNLETLEPAITDTFLALLDHLRSELHHARRMFGPRATVGMLLLAQSASVAAPQQMRVVGGGDV